MKRRHRATKEERYRIEALVKKQGKKDRPRKDARELVEAMLWIFKTGAPWRDLPEYYGPRKTGYNNFLRWRDEGLWEHILLNLNLWSNIATQFYVVGNSENIFYLLNRKYIWNIKAVFSQIFRNKHINTEFMQIFCK